jgi:hypothetical protein
MAMFEQEIEMEKRESSVVPLLLIVVMIVSIVGVSVYYLLQSKKVLTSQEATTIALAAVKAQGPATIHFHTGMIKGSVEEKPHDPHYRLLEKAGLIRLGKDTGPYGMTTPVALTLDGQRLFSDFPGATKVRDKDGTDAYVIPLAERKLVEVTKITMNGPTHATIEYTWKWEPNKLGNLFDASGSMVKSFNTWDRATLIQKYGANFYHGEPTKVSLAVMKTDRGWEISTE